MNKITIRSYDYDKMCERVETFRDVKPVNAIKKFSEKYPSCQTLLLDIDFEDGKSEQSLIDKAFPKESIQ